MNKRRVITGLNSGPSVQQNPEFADWEVGNDYEVEKIIGIGSYGSVCRAVQKSTGKRVAIKRM